MFRRSRVFVAIAAAIVVVSIGAAPARADFPQFQITHFGTAGDLTQEAGFPAAAYDARTNQYLVVYEAGGKTPDTNHWKIYGQRLDAAGAPVGSPFQISADTTNQLCQEEPPSVAFDQAANQFLVVWDEGTSTSCDDAIYAQRIAADGTLVGTPSERISKTGYKDIETTAVAFNPSANQWFVAWNAIGSSGANQELWGQRLTADGTEIGTDDQQLTDFHANGGRSDDAIGLAYDSRDSRYLVVVRGIDPTVFASHDEIYGHLMSADGTTIGPDHFRISHVTATNPTGDAKPPRAAYDSRTNRFLVTWTGNPKIGSMAAGENDVFGHLVGSDGSLVGTDDTRYSDMGPDGSIAFTPQRPDMGFNPNAGEYFLAWAGDGNTAPLVDGESEAFGQRVAGDGSELGNNDFRISHDGPDGDPNYAANRPALAFNSSTCQYLVAWSAGQLGTFGASSEEWEIWGNVVDSPCPPVNLAAPTLSGTAQQSRALTCSQGSWSGRGMSFAYRWNRSGTAITGAAAATYVATAADVGQPVTCTVTATDPDGAASATSAAVTPIGLPSVPPAFGAKTLISLGLASSRVPAKGPVKIRVSNGNAFTVTGKLSGETAKLVTVARKRRVKLSAKAFTVASHGTKTVTLKLPKALQRLLAQKHKLSLRLTANVRDPAGLSRTVTKTVTVRLKQTKKH